MDPHPAEPPAGGTARRRVAVCICTHRRPAELDRLLTRLRDVAAEAAATCTVGVVVVDDDQDRSASPVVAAHAEAFELGLTAAHAGRRNISIARNTALAGGADLADWLAFIDDDCVPDPGWLRELVATQTATGADGVSGRCVDVAPDDGPRWFAEEPFLVEVVEHPDRAPIESGAMKNLLLSREVVGRPGVALDEAFGLIGGEDVMFFRALQAAGADIRFSARAVVREQIPLARAQLRYQLGRSLWHGNTEAVTSLAAGGGGRTRMAARGVKQVLASVWRPLRRLVGGERPQIRYAACGALLGIGRVLGSAGVRLHHR